MVEPVVIEQSPPMGAFTGEVPPSPIYIYIYTYIYVYVYIYICTYGEREREASIRLLRFSWFALELAGIRRLVVHIRRFERDDLVPL